MITIIILSIVLSIKAYTLFGNLFDSRNMVEPEVDININLKTNVDMSQYKSSNVVKQEKETCPLDLYESYINLVVSDMHV